MTMGTPVLVTLLTGLLIAFAVQLLLTTFGIAAGITAIGYLPSAQSDAAAETDQEPGKAPDAGGSGTAGKIGFAVGAGTLLTVNTVLFVASFLAVKLSLVSTITVGAVLGVVIWSGYFLTLTWLSSKAAGTVLGMLVGAVSAGVQGLMTTIMTALGRKKDSKDTASALPAGLDQRLAATESSLETLQTQLEANTRTVETTLQEYVQTLQAPKLDVDVIRREVAAILRDAGLPSLGREMALSQIDRQMLGDLVRSRTDFSQQDVNQVVDQLEAVWQEVAGGQDAIADLTTFFQSASPDQLTPEGVRARLQALRQNHRTPESTSASSTNPSPMSLLEPKQLIKQLAQTIRDRVDLSDLDVGKILHQLQALTQDSDAGGDAKSPIVPFNTTIQADVEAYLLNTYPWNLTRKTVKAEFKDVIYDPEANPVAVRQQLLALNRKALIALLEQREDLTPKKIDKIADRLEEARQEVEESLEAVAAEASSKAFQTQVSDYLRTASKNALKPASLQKQLRALLQQVGHPLQSWSDRLQDLTRDRLVASLKERQDLSSTEVAALTTQLETVRDRLVAESQTRQAALASEATALWQKLGDYVSDRSQKLTARNIQRQLKALVKATKIEFDDLRHALPSFDAESVKQWLADRQDLSEKQQQRVLNQLEKSWNSLLQDAQASAHVSRSDVSPVLTVLTDYLQHIDPATCNGAEQPQDLLHYLTSHHLSGERLGELTQNEWSSFVQQIHQRQDLTTEQQQQLLEQFQQAIYTLGKLPRRFTLRAKRQRHHWQDTLSDYLRYAEREDLSVDRLPHLLQRLLHEIQAPDHAGNGHWVEFLQQALSSIDHAHLMTLLSERGDLTEAEVSHLLEKLKMTLKQAIEQAKTLQQQAQDTIAATFEQLRHYITSLPLPDLDYDRLKDELQQLLVDPRLELETLSRPVGDMLCDQLGRFNRHTLSALLSARDDLSETVAQKLLDRVDAVRLSAIDQVKTLQQEAQRRVDSLKQQAQHQAEETRKAIATAAWWLFATAFSSALSAAIAGAMAVGGLHWLEQVIG